MVGYWTQFSAVFLTALLAAPAFAAGIAVRQLPDTPPAEQMSRADLLAQKGYYPQSCAERSVCIFTGPGGEAASGATRAHGASLATSAASAAISRAAALCSASSNTRRPDCAASAKTTRWPMVLESTGGSWSAKVSAVSRAMTVRAPQRFSTKRAAS